MGRPGYIWGAFTRVQKMKKTVLLQLLLFVLVSLIGCEGGEQGGAARKRLQRLQRVAGRGRGPGPGSKQARGGYHCDCMMAPPPFFIGLDRVLW